MKNNLFLSYGRRILPLIITLMCLQLISFSLQSQTVYPVSVSSQMIIGGSVYIGDFTNPMATAGKLNFTLTLLDPIETQRTVYFRITIAQNGTILASNPIGFRGNQITLERNIPYHINGEDLAQNLNINNLYGLAGPNAYGVLNEGITDICLEVVDAVREEPISARVCATGYLARLQAPILILPIDGQNLFESQLNNLVFTWQMTDPLAHLPFANIEYLFELREKSPLLDPQDQFENHTLIYNTTLDHFSLFYNELASQLDPSTTYIWRVTAKFYDQQGNQAPNYFVNNGISRIGTFQVLPDLNINSGESGVSCFCPNGECDVLFPTNSAPSRNLMVGDSIRYGYFSMKVKELDGSGTSGLGSVRIPFLNTSVSVEFDNININDQFEVTQGEISPISSQLVSTIGIDSDHLPDLSSILMGSTWLSEMNEHVKAIQESMSLPISLGNKLALLGFTMPFDVFVTDIDFNAYGAATVNLLMSIPGTDGHIINFGATGVKIGRNGFDMAGLKLYLLSDITIPGLSSLPLVIRKAVQNDPSVGSYITFGCNGFEQFNLQCSYTFPSSQLQRTDNSELPVVADITLKSSSWGQFIGYGSIDNFSLTGAPGWNFSAQNIILDLDQLTNPTEIKFPVNYLGNNGSSWKGFYIDRVSVELPEDISMAAGNSTEFSANNIILDSEGMTCRADGVDILDISTGAVGGWAYSIDSISVNIFQNSFVDAHVSGKMGIGVLDAEIDYQGLIFKDNSNNYSFNLSPVGSFTIPYLMLTASIDQGSYLAIEKQPVTNKYKPYADLNMSVELDVKEDDFRNAGLGSIVDELKSIMNIDDFDFGVTGIKFNHFKINHPDLPIGKHFSLESTDGGAIVIPGLSDINLSDLKLLEQERDFNGINLPALGIDIQMQLGFASIGVGVWAKKDSAKTDGYKFGKFELKLPDFSGMSFKCNCDPPVNIQGEAPKPNFCIAPILTGGIPTGIQANDRIKVGHFVMRVEEVNGNQGKGKMEVPFLNLLLDVEFNNIQVHKMPNGEKRLIGGVVLTSPNASLGGFNVEVGETESPMDLSALSVTSEFMDQMENLSSEEGGFFSMPFSISEKMDEMIGVALPEGFDFILLGMKFEPSGAKLSSMLTLKLPGDNFMKFGLSGMNIRPDGFNLDGIQIYLTKDFIIQN